MTDSQAPGLRAGTYLRLLGIFYRNSLLNEMEYRLKFWANVGLSLFWLVWAALSVRVYFRFTGTIAGWAYHEVLVVMGLFFTVNGIHQALITPNLARMTEYVQKGTLDYLLTKPVDSQFLVSLRHIGVHNWADPLLGLGLVGYGLARGGTAPDAGAVGLFAVLLAAATVLLYGVSLLLQTLTIWSVSSRGMDDVIEGLLETGRFPVSFYGGAVQGLLTAVVPVAFMTTFPAEALLGRAGWPVAVLAVTVSATIFLAASVFWRFALRSYTGAGS